VIEPNSGHQETAQRQSFSHGRSLRSWHLMQPSLRIADLDARWALTNGRWALTNGMVWSPFVRAAWVHEFRPIARSAARSCRCQARYSRSTAHVPRSRGAEDPRGSRSMNTRRYSPASTASLRTAATATRLQFRGDSRQNGWFFRVPSRNGRKSGRFGSVNRRRSPAEFVRI
jgi:hypothetical protein